MSKHFPTEVFYTEDFDQEMMDFIKRKYAVYKGGNMEEYWNVRGEYLKYSSFNDFFWTSDVVVDRDYVKLTKQQFKQKIGMEENMTTKQFTKADLVAGKHVVETSNGYSYIFIGNDVLQGMDNLGSWNSLKDFDEDLSCIASKEYDIQSVYRVEESGSIAYSKHRSSRKLVWERTSPKTASQIELEKLQQQIVELQTQANKLQATL